MYTKQEQVCVSDTHFIYKTNFSGDPTRDNFGDARRKVNLVLPDEEQALALLRAGFNVKQSKPGKNDNPDTFRPEYYVMVQTKYRRDNGEPVNDPPQIYLVAGKSAPVLMDEETVEQLDHIRVLNVNAVLNLGREKDGKRSIFVETMYVEQDLRNDPYAARYRQEMAKAEEFEAF